MLQTVLDADLFSLPEPYCNLDQLTVCMCSDSMCVCNDMLQTVLDADLFSLPEPYCNLDQLPAQAVRVRLAGVRPLQMEYTVTDEGKVVGTME